MYLRQGDADSLLGRGTSMNWTAREPRAAGSGPAGVVDDRLPRISLMGVSLHAIDEQQCIGHILTELDAGRGGVVVTPNLDHLRRCRADSNFAALVAEADLAVADGMPLVWASRLQGTPLPQRVAGSDLISSLSGACAGAGRSIFLLGGEEGAAERAAEVLTGRFANLQIAGMLCPPIGFEQDKARMAEIASALAVTKPDVVFVALGSPKQERLIDSLRHSLPAAWWLGVGVSFSFLSGQVRRAPLWMRRTGLEWVHRLVQEPRRLFKRYVMVGLPFAGYLMVRSTGRGVLNRLSGRKVAEAKPPALSDPAEHRAQAVNPPPQVHEVQLSGAAEVKGEVKLPGRLRALVLLGGTVRAGGLAEAVERNILDLPIGNGRTLWTHWLAEARGMELAVRLLLDVKTSAPQSAGDNGAGWTVERDTSELRGTGGLLADVARAYADEDLIAVGNAAQLLLDPLGALLAELNTLGGVVSLVGHRDGTPSGLMLVTCGALRLIPKVGFVDMKEQALTAIAARHEVRVLQRRRPTGLPIRSRADYISALQEYHRPAELAERNGDALAEDWKSSFAIVEEGATVSPKARVHDSVVISGATVEPGAVLVRSVVAAGAVVRRDRKVVDECVGKTSSRKKVRS